MNEAVKELEKHTIVWEKIFCASRESLPFVVEIENGCINIDECYLHVDSLETLERELEDVKRGFEKRIDEYQLKLKILDEIKQIYKDNFINN